jgi:hypothetical protein
MLMIRSKQTPLTRRSVTPRPLMPLSAVMWRLDRHEADIIAMIEEGDLLWAFDIRAPKAVKPEPRILTQSVVDFLAGNRPPLQDEETEWQRVASLIFPAKPVLVRCELAALLNCGRSHAMDLVRGCHFRLAPGHTIRPGPGGSPHIIADSVKDWLRKRRML